MKLSDYIVAQLADWGVTDIFLVTGGGAMHLNDVPIRLICKHARGPSPGTFAQYYVSRGQGGSQNL